MRVKASRARAQLDNMPPVQKRTGIVFIAISDRISIKLFLSCPTSRFSFFLLQVAETGQIIINKKLYLTLMSIYVKQQSIAINELMIYTIQNVKSVLPTPPTCFVWCQRSSPVNIGISSNLNYQ